MERLRFPSGFKRPKERHVSSHYLGSYARNTNRHDPASPTELGAVTTPRREEPLVQGLGGLYETVPSSVATPPTLRYVLI